MQICQISKETNLLSGNKNCEPYQRQLSYLNAIKRKSGEGSVMTIIVLSSEFKGIKFEDNGLKIFSISSSFWGRFFQIYKTLYSINRRSPINVLTSQVPIDEGWIVLLFGKIFKIPVIAQIHFDIFDNNAITQTLGEGLRGRLRFKIFQKTIKYHDKIRVVGNRITKNLIDSCSCNLNQITLIPVMVPLLNQTSNFRRVIKANVIFKVLFVGRLVEQKNLFFLLEIASEIINKDKSVIFEIVGNGPLKNKLIAECKRQNLENNVIFYGEIPNAHLPNYYSNADVFILTSFYEGFGRVIVEAGAYKLPVLSTRITGPEDIIEPGFNGYLFELNDKKGFVEKILYLKNYPDERLRMGTNNYNLVHDRYNPDILRDKWIELLIN